MSIFGKIMSAIFGHAAGATPPSGGAASSAGTGGTTSNGDACSTGNACVACLCQHCPMQVETCEATPGCQEIANCVATNRCNGLACDCGTVDELSCAAGQADGPCRDVILNAPGGRKPTLANQSAGPATDAAIALGNCGAMPNNGCVDSCQ